MTTRRPLVPNNFPEIRRNKSAMSARASSMKAVLIASAIAGYVPTAMAQVPPPAPPPAAPPTAPAPAPEPPLGDDLTGTDDLGAPPPPPPPPPVTAPAPGAPIEGEVELDVVGDEDEEMVMAGPVAAPAPTSKKNPDEVVTVTGSLIAQDAGEGAGHVTVVTAEQIRRTSATTADEVLRKMPTVTLGGINKNDNNGGGGLAFVELRNLGINRTLVLVNGRRFITNGTGVSEAVDLNNIPTAMIERIDVLLDGASALYGSDAVGGVINIILKDDFEGLRADVNGGISQKGDAEEIGGALTLGTNYDRGNITVNIQGMVRKPVWQKERDWARDAVSQRQYINGFNGDDGVDTIMNSSTVFEGRVGGTTFTPDPKTGKSFSPLTNDTRSSFSRRQYLVGSQERIQLTALADYDITNRVRAYSEGTTTFRHSQTRLAPAPLNGISGTFTDGFNIPVLGNEFVPKDYAATLPAGTTTVPFVKRVNEAGDRIFDDDSFISRVIIGLAGDLPKYELNWDIYANYGVNRTTSTTTNQINLSRVLESGDPSLCALPINQAKGCVDGNYFGLDSLNTTPGVVDYIRYNDSANAGYGHFSSGATISARPVELWAGKLGLAAGTLYRYESGFNNPSEIVVNRESSGNANTPTKGNYKSAEVFGEINLPLARDLPGIEELTIDGAGRFSWYDSFGSETTYRAQLLYAPVDFLKLRGTYSTSFRAPAISDLFRGSSDSFLTLEDPCNNWESNSNATIRETCMQQGVPMGYNQNNLTGTQIRTNIAGNPKLNAETAKVIDIGGTFSPTFLPKAAGNLTFGLDWYRIVVDDAITTPTPQYLLTSCYDGTSPENCDKIVRVTGTGSINVLNAQSQNIGKTETGGWDLTAAYDLGLSAIGLPSWARLNLGWSGNRLRYYNDTIEGDKLEYAGTITAGQGTYTQWRWNVNATFSGDSWSVTSTNRYLGGAKYFGIEYGSQPDDYVEPILYWDLAAQYSPVEGFTIIGGVSNVLNTDPPFFLDGSTNSNAGSYDFIGRFFFTRLSYKM